MVAMTRAFKSIIIAALTVSLCGCGVAPATITFSEGLGIGMEDIEKIEMRNDYGERIEVTDRAIIEELYGKLKDQVLERDPAQEARNGDTTIDFYVSGKTTVIRYGINNGFTVFQDINSNGQGESRGIYRPANFEDMKEIFDDFFQKNS